MIPIIHPRQTQGIKILTALFLFFLIPLTTKSQTQVFPEKDAIWCVKNNYSDKSQFIYGLQGDTLIGGKEYSKLYYLNDTTLNIDEKDQYIGAIRTEARKVYFYPNNHYSNTDKELLMYDFPENAQDVVITDFAISYLYEPIPFFSPSKYIYKISSIQKDIMGRSHYLISRISVHDEDEWIEGIGSVKGLFWYPYEPSDGLSGRGSIYSDIRLVSLKQGDSIVYHNKEVCDQPFCWFGVGVEDTQQTPSIALYPNPVKETLHIDLGDTPLPVRFDLFDPQGRIIYTETLTTSHSNLTLPPHHKGLRHYRLTGSDGNPYQSGQLLFE